MNQGFKYPLLTIVLVCFFGTDPACSRTTQWDKYIDAGNAAYRQRQYARALESFSAALKEAESFGPNDSRLATSLNNLALVYDEQGKYAEAEPLYKRALAILEKAFGPNHSSVATSLNNLAALYCSQGKYAEAEPLYKRSLQIREGLDPNGPDVAQSLANYAVLLRKTKRVEQAKQMELRAKRIRAELGHRDSFSTGGAGANLRPFSSLPVPKAGSGK